MSAVHASLTDIPVADVDHTDAKWTPVRNHFGITAFGVNAYTARNAGDRLIGEHDHADPTDERHQELYFVHSGHALFRVDGQDVDAPAGTFVCALDVKTIRSAVALSDNTVVLVIGAEPGAPFEVTPWEVASKGKAVECREPTQRCTAEFQFHGTTGKYDLDVQYFDQNNGISSFKVSVNGRQVDAWKADDHLPTTRPDENSSTRKQIFSVKLQPGDQILIEGLPDGEERAPLDYIELQATTP